MCMLVSFFATAQCTVTYSFSCSPATVSSYQIEIKIDGVLQGTFSEVSSANSVIGAATLLTVLPPSVFIDTSQIAIGSILEECLVASDVGCSDTQDNVVCTTWTNQSCTDCDGDGTPAVNDVDDNNPCVPNPTSLSTNDCDGDGTTIGQGDTDDSDPCVDPDLVNPTPAYLAADCDGDGITNDEEINTDNTDPNDPCSNTYTSTELCAFVTANPTSPLATADCDNGGNSNIDECNAGGNPLDGSDDIVVVCDLEEIVKYKFDTDNCPFSNPTIVSTGQPNVYTSSDCELSIDDYTLDGTQKYGFSTEYYEAYIDNVYELNVSERANFPVGANSNMEGYFGEITSRASDAACINPTNCTKINILDIASIQPGTLNGGGILTISDTTGIIISVQAGATLVPTSSTTYDFIPTGGSQLGFILEGNFDYWKFEVTGGDRNWDQVDAEMSAKVICDCDCP